MFNGENMNAFSLRSGIRQGCPLLPLLFNTVLEVLTIAIRQEKEKESKLERKKQNCHCLQMTWLLYIENPKDTTRKLVELINKLGKVAGYKINIQKSFAFLYTNNELPGRETKETIPFTITSKRMKYLGINLPKEVKDLYLENYKTLMKETEDDTNRWKDIPCFWTGRINIVKMTILPNNLQIQCDPY